MFIVEIFLVWGENIDFPLQVEIRGCSIEATERIVEAARGLLQAEGGGDVSSIKVDFFLWDYRVKNAVEMESVPYHRVRCIYY